MDLDIILWMIGTLFSLGIFAIKVGFGLSFGRIKWKGVFLTISLYLVLFILIALFSERLIKIFEPVLRRGPYLHALMAIGMIVWGSVLLRTEKTQSLVTHHSLLLLVPCPVCFTAMTFSTWAALSVIKLPALLIGVGLGIVFVTLSSLLFFSLKLITHHSSLVTSRIGLGLSMMGIGLYFLASLFLPEKIEEAKGVYRSFLTEGNNIDINNSIGVFALLFVAMLIGFFSREVKR